MFGEVYLGCVGIFIFINGKKIGFMFVEWIN